MQHVAGPTVLAAALAIASLAACPGETPSPEGPHAGTGGDAAVDAAAPTSGESGAGSELDASGARSTDAGALTAAAIDAASLDAGAGGDAAVASGEVKRLFVREVRVDCSGEGPRKCLQVRESTTAPWTNLYAPITGFTYEESYAYELKVAPERTPNAPADAPTKRWRLLEIVSKKKVAHPKK